MAFNWNKFPWTNLHELNLDWIIQTVKQLENKVAELGVTVANAVQEFTTKLPATVQDAITEALTGSGDLTINKTGDVNITGNNVRITSGSHAQITGGAFISGASEQLTLHNPNSKKSMTANYNSGVLTLTNNQDLAAGVAVYPINTPADGGGDNSTFAANVGYVKTAVETVSTALATETENRTSGDAALQSTIDNVIMPILTKVEKRAPRVVYMLTQGVEQGYEILTDEDMSNIKTALLNHTPIMLCVDSHQNSAQFLYNLDNCAPVPDNDNIDGALSLTFKTVSGNQTATLDLGTKTVNFS